MGQIRIANLLEERIYAAYVKGYRDSLNTIAGSPKTMSSIVHKIVHNRYWNRDKIIIFDYSTMNLYYMILQIFRGEYTDGELSNNTKVINPLFHTKRIMCRADLDRVLKSIPKAKTTS